MAWIKAGEFAAQLGVSGAAVRKAIAEGRLKSARKEGKGWLIDAEAGVNEWDRNTSPQFQRGRMLARQLAQQEQQQEAPAPAAGTAGLGGKAIPSQAHAAAVRTMYQARLLELDLKQRQGELVRVDVVTTGQFKIIRMFRDAVQNIPIRVVSELAAVVGDVDPARRHEMMLVMQREIDRCLEQLADSHGPR